MCSTSHDWQLPALVPSAPQEEYHGNAPGRFQLRFLFLMAFLACIARFLKKVAYWLLDDDEIDEYSCEPSSTLVQNNRKGNSSTRNLFFDKKNMLRPYFGQTFKVMRVGIK
eukprot:673756-Hanusia_phi.AAC.1